MIPRILLRAKLSLLLPDKTRFQQLINEDCELFGKPGLFFIDPPESNDAQSNKKLADWVAWRAAPYPVTRHSEYLFKYSNDFIGKGPRILVSAILNLAEYNNPEEYVQQFNAKQRYNITGRKAQNLGYIAKTIIPQDHSEDIFNIIHSTQNRQGRPVASLYLNRPIDYNFPDYIDYQDANYKDICAGVFSNNGQMVAYLLGKRVGDHVQYDEIMGHNDHVVNHVMFYLHYYFIQICFEQEIIPRCLNYGPWYSGADPYDIKKGLNYWKRKNRFQPAYLITASY